MMKPYQPSLKKKPPKKERKETRGKDQSLGKQTSEPQGEMGTNEDQNLHYQHEAYQLNMCNK